MSYRKGLAVTAAIAVLGLVSIPAAQASAATPEFAVQNAANSNIRGGYNAYTRGDYKIAKTFNVRATAKGIKKSRRSIAYSNLCATLGQLNTLDAALDACNSAVKMAPNNWRALNNRGVVNYLAGKKDAAMADFTTAAGSPDAALAQANADLMAGTKLATSE